MRIYFSTVSASDYYAAEAINSIWLEPNEDAEYYMNIPSTDNLMEDEERPSHWHPYNGCFFAGEYIKTNNGNYIPESEYDYKDNEYDTVDKYETYKNGKLIKTEYE